MNKRVDEVSDDQDASPADTFNLDNLPSTGTKPPHSRIAPKPDVHSPLPSKYTHINKPSERSNSNHINNNIQPRLVPKVNKIPDNYDDVFNVHSSQYLLILVEKGLHRSANQIRQVDVVKGIRGGEIVGGL